MEAIVIETKPTHIGSRRMAAQRAQNRIMKILRIDEEAYSWHKYKAGLAFLRHYTRGDHDAIRWISGSRIYWGWWKNEWLNREEEFLLDAYRLDKLPVKVRRRAYFQANNPRTLAHELHPEAGRIAHSYSVMLEALTSQKSNDHED